jgi:outer membrane protein assembly factor BamE (lipoprotein component of BamABCDE complex)
VLLAEGEVPVKALRSSSRFNVALALLASLRVAACNPEPVLKVDYERFRSIKVGMTEQEVREKLGAPVHVYETRSAPKDYYVKGYSFKERPITNKVLIYIASEPIAYIYVDHQAKVEEVFVGGS